MYCMKSTVWLLISPDDNDMFNLTKPEWKNPTQQKMKKRLKNLYQSITLACLDL